MFMFRAALPLSAFALSLTLSATTAHADRVLGDYLGTFGGNDNAAAVSLNVGETVVQLAKVEAENHPDTSEDGLTLSMLVLKDGEDDEHVSGWWDYAGPETVDYLVVKAGPNYAIYEYNDVITNNMPNMGLWDTTDVDGKGYSHITAYNVVPEPGSAVLLMCGAAGLMRRRRRH